MAPAVCEKGWWMKGFQGKETTKQVVVVSSSSVSESFSVVFAYFQLIPWIDE